MRVLYIAHSGNIQGAGLALINVIRGMLTCGVEPVVFLPAVGPVSEQLAGLGVRCIFTPFYMEIFPPLKGIRNWVLWGPRFMRTLVCNASSSLKLRKTIREIQPDIIHTNTGVIHFSAKVARVFKIPHVWHVREFQDLHFGWTPFGGMRGLSKLFNEECNHCVSVTQAVFEHYEMSIHKARVIYDGVFDMDIPPDIVWEKKDYFLFVGRIQEGKGVRDAVVAFLKVAPRYPKKQLWIAGDGCGAFVESLYHLVEQSGLGERVRFLGFRTDVYQLMSTAQALIVSSRFEGFGYITAEGMLNGCLVIGNNTAGTKEQFDNGVAQCGNEIGIRYTGVDQLAERIEEICNKSAGSIRPIIERAQSVAFRLYSMNKNVEELYEYYQEILEGINSEKGNTRK